MNHTLFLLAHYEPIANEDLDNYGATKWTSQSSKGFESHFSGLFPGASTLKLCGKLFKHINVEGLLGD